MLLGTLFFAEAIFGVVGRLQTQLAQQNQELLPCTTPGSAFSASSIWRPSCNRSSTVPATSSAPRYGALSLLREGGGIEAFLTSGITAEERERIGPIPVGHGLLEVVLVEGQPLRLDDLNSDPRSVGFPRITRQCTRCSPCPWSRTAVCWASLPHREGGGTHFRCR